MSDLLILNFSDNKKSVSDYVLNGIYLDINEIFLDKKKPLEKLKNIYSAFSSPKMVLIYTDSKTDISQLEEFFKNSKIFHHTELLGHKRLAIKAIFIDISNNKIHKMPLSFSEFNKFQQAKYSFIDQHEVYEAYKKLKDFAVNNAYSRKVSEFNKNFEAYNPIKDYVDPYIFPQSTDTSPTSHLYQTTLLKTKEEIKRIVHSKQNTWTDLMKSTLYLLTPARFHYSPMESKIHIAGTSQKNTILMCNMAKISKVYLEDIVKENTVQGSPENNDFYIHNLANNNTIYGDDGSDQFHISDDTCLNQLFGNNDSDYFYLNNHSYSNTCHGNDGQDFFVVSDKANRNILQAGNHQDTFILKAFTHQNFVFGGNGNDLCVLRDNAQNNYIELEHGDDVVLDASLGNIINTGAGNDLIVYHPHKPSSNHDLLGSTLMIGAGDDDDIIYTLPSSNLFNSIHQYYRAKPYYLIDNLDSHQKSLSIEITLGQGRDKFFFNENNVTNCQTTINDYNPGEDMLCFASQTTGQKIMRIIMSDFYQKKTRSTFQHNGHKYDVRFENSKNADFKYGIYDKKNVFNILTNKDFSGLNISSLPR